MNSKINRRYLAGLFDGEGCIFYNKIYHKDKKRDTGINIGVSISNTYKPIMEMLYNEFGGHFRERISKHQFETGRYRKVIYELVLRNAKAESFIRECLPYLIIKKERAELALELRKNTNNYQGSIVPMEEIQRRMGLIEKLSLLNKMGVSSLEFKKQLACGEC